MRRLAPSRPKRTTLKVCPQVVGFLHKDALHVPSFIECGAPHHGATGAGQAGSQCLTANHDTAAVASWDPSGEGLSLSPCIWPRLPSICAPPFPVNPVKSLLRASAMRLPYRASSAVAPPNVQPVAARGPLRGQLNARLPLTDSPLC